MNLSVSIRRFSPFRLCAFVFLGLILSAAASTTLSLSGPGWQLWRDTAADWQHEALYAPGTPLDKVAVRPPTGGWAALDAASKLSVSVPGTVEEYCTDLSGYAAASAAREHEDSDIANYATNADTMLLVNAWRKLQGVSWWVRSFTVPAFNPGQRLLIRFGSCRYRAEVFLDRKLVASDMAFDTEFTVDVTGRVKPGATAELAVRITNPGGDYDWRDYMPVVWNGTKLPGSRSAGGITGDVAFEVHDPVYFDDFYVLNTPDPHTVTIVAAVLNTTDVPLRCGFDLAVAPGHISDMRGVTVSSGSMTFAPGITMVTNTFTDASARLWSPDSPSLYHVNAVLAAAPGKDADQESAIRAFGFRWFAPDGVGGTNAVCRLNGKRIFLTTAISWGWWPVGATVPPPGYAAKQVAAAKSFGMNMLNFHRCMGRPEILNQADQQGLFYFAEPGGVQGGAQSALGQQILDERNRRMVKMFRSHPSLIIYNLINERTTIMGGTKIALDDAYFTRAIRAIHTDDPSRTVVMTSGFTRNERVDEFNKLAMFPYDTNTYTKGWFDQHHAVGPKFSWLPSFYVSTMNYYHKTSDPGEIIYWGEEGAMASPAALDSAVAELDKIGHDGWDGAVYRVWRDRTAAYLDAKGLRKTWPTVNDFCRMLGAPAWRHQGRKLALLRATDETDGYAINGWEAMPVENNSGIVDCFRNSKADPSLLTAAGTAPLALVVNMTPAEVFAVPARLSVDVRLVNTVGLSGSYTLKVEQIVDGEVVATAKRRVEVVGGETFGQLLATNVAFDVVKAGVGSFRARLGGFWSEKARGATDFFAFATNAPAALATRKIAVFEEGEGVRTSLVSSGVDASVWDPKASAPCDVLVVACAPDAVPGAAQAVLAAARAGARVLVLDHADRWAPIVAPACGGQYNGKFVLGDVWVGGHYFTTDNPVFDGFPKNEAMDVPFYQIADGGKNRYALRLEGEELIAGAWQSLGHKLGTAIGRYRLGKGTILLSSLNLVPNRDTPAGRQLLFNLFATADAR